MCIASNQNNTMVKSEEVTKRVRDTSTMPSPYVARNISKIQKSAGVNRAAKGVGEAIMQHDVYPVLQTYIRLAMQQAQRSGRSTIRHSHGEYAYDLAISQSSE